jgi:transposase
LHRKGESDLVYRDGMWFLNATCEVPETPLNTDPVDFLGVDLGIVNIASTSDGEIMAGRQINRSRVRERALRTKLRKKNTPSAKRRLKKRRHKEARRAKDINHKIAKHMVAEAERTGRGIALAWFACRSCGFVDHADRNSSRNIRARAWEVWRRGAPSTAPAPPPRQRGGAGRKRSVTASDARCASPSP